MLSLGEGIVALRIKPNVFVMSSTSGRAVAGAVVAARRDLDLADERSTRS
jgi:hypothetical protein